MKRFFFFLLLSISALTISAQKRAMTVEDMWNMKRITSFDLSPDGKSIVFAATSYDMDKNKGNSDIWMISSEGKYMHAIKNSEDGESAPKFTTDGNKIAYEFKNNIWLCDLDGTNNSQLTDLYTGVSRLVWSKDGKFALFVSSVYPDCTTQLCNEKKDKEAEESKVKAKIFTELMYRHWNEWRGDKRSHLFLLNVSTKEYVDLTLNSKFDVPPIALGGDVDYALSPDGNEVAFTMNTDKDLATSTNNDVFIINNKAAGNYKKISASNGNDNGPVYSPDEKFIAFHSMARTGFEADKQTLVLYNRATGELKNVTEKLDISIGQILFSPDGKFVYYDSDREAFHSIYKYNLETGENKVLIKDGTNSSMKLSPDGNTIYFLRHGTTLPTEIFSMDTNGNNLKQITNINSNLISYIEFGEFDTFWSSGANKAKVQSIIVKPPFFNPNNKYPLMFLIHGGPQGNWADDFHYRWNLQMFAAKGYVVVAPNPRGSTGYGQKFTDEISGDWGGKVYTDLMNAYDYVLKNFKFIDAKNTFASGASYGGYMINWIEGHTTRFNALFCHDGVFNLESMWGTTEELWFPEWEMKGTPYSNRALHQKWSPHQFVNNFKTPMLIVHGALDYRVPEGQAFELFTALQRKGVSSKFLYFPEEYHFVTKPQNARLWWNTIFDWFEQYKK
ncbi:MAG: S9 family peptidase [Ignavibacteriales bacterium]|nr:S9 family peptidase [Ignavibacteriales bacterium]